MKRFLTLTFVCLAVALGAMAENEPVMKVVADDGTHELLISNIKSVEYIYYDDDDPDYPDETFIQVTMSAGGTDVYSWNVSGTTITFQDVPTAIDGIEGDSKVANIAKMLYQMGNIEFKDVNGKVIKTLKKQEE